MKRTRKLVLSIVSALSVPISSQVLAQCDLHISDYSDISSITAKKHIREVLENKYGKYLMLMNNDFKYCVFTDEQAERKHVQRVFTTIDRATNANAKERFRCSDASVVIVFEDSIDSFANSEKIQNFGRQTFGDEWGAVRQIIGREKSDSRTRVPYRSVFRSYDNKTLNGFVSVIFRDELDGNPEDINLFTTVSIVRGFLDGQQSDKLCPSIYNSNLDGYEVTNTEPIYRVDLAILKTLFSDVSDVYRIIRLPSTSNIKLEKEFLRNME